MSLIKVNNLTFCYNKGDNIFENASFSLDTDWRLGLTGRNGRGKTTLLELFMGKHEYTGSINYSVNFDYFPFETGDNSKTTLSIIRRAIADFDFMERRMAELTNNPSDENLEEYGELLAKYEALDGFVIDELITAEVSKLNISGELLLRPFETLSGGERTKVLLAALFLKKNNFLLIDEPTNHLDAEGRELLAKYLKSKKSFLLVSHDRNFLDESIDHIMVINKASISVGKGDFSTWEENKRRQDGFERAQNEKLAREVGKMTEAAKRTAEWSDKLEQTKIGGHVADRGAVGHKAAKMMKHSKETERKRERVLDEKRALLKNTEYENTLKLTPLSYKGGALVETKELTIRYENGRNLFAPLSFRLQKGERLRICGANGSGKSSILKMISGLSILHSGEISLGSQIIISYVSQDTSGLCGDLSEYAKKLSVDESLFKTILIKLDFKRLQFDKPIEAYSEGQKKKVLLAASLSKSAHLYIWDEPLNFIDILSREQIEQLILSCLVSSGLTMIFVEHDRDFAKKIATRTILL